MPNLAASKGLDEQSAGTVPSTMIFKQTELAGVVEVHLDPRSDERGFFARSWCEGEFASHGLNPKLVQCNVSFNVKKGTMRGMHYQAEPFQEAKVVRCTQGAIYDVAVDLRPQSATFKQWFGTVLSAENRNMLFLPEGCAHGFLTLTENAEVFYQMSEFYHPESACGVRFDDPAFRIVWPEKIEVISERDRTYPNFKA
jgi:dTDP-4-dehydrorhamnose 3,5-epimerase